ncbi:uncharacterized protein [Parasteatoda tepidariorum]|uniref:uncharacterized protein n=1 Tax=Parasteatoda tepidariorum TaxID=114398 RepID=UPI00077FD594|nr:uncharacterized protein LOC107441548 [Parasteatoda tepidariorum]
MICIKKFLILILLSVGSKSCPSKYSKASDATCLHLGDPKPSDGARDFYCNNEGGGKQFGRPVPDDLIDGLSKLMKSASESWMPSEVFLAMRRKGAEDSFGPKETTWLHHGDDTEIEERDYPLWYRNPNGEDCATTGRGYNFLANPDNCGRGASLLCEKTSSPCYLDEVNYVEYEEHCLTVIKDARIYDMALDGCTQGQLFSMKTEEDRSSVIQAFYNTLFSGGIYIGLTKQDDGTWLYNSGDEEEAEVPGFGNCGVLKLMEDAKTLSLSSVQCDNERLFFLCEISTTGKSDVILYNICPIYII